MAPPDLERLRSGPDSREWDYAIAWLWPSVVAVVKEKLGWSLRAEVEDVAIEALEAVIEKVYEVKEVQELKLLAIVVARNKAIDFLRKFLAPKHGGGNVQSLEEAETECPPAMEFQSMIALVPLDTTELRELLTELMNELRPEERTLLAGFYFLGMCYAELARVSKIPIGTVGVVLSRATKKLHKAIAKSPKIMKELKEYLR